jgi:hypothetical protein
MRRSLFAIVWIAALLLTGIDGPAPPGPSAASTASARLSTPIRATFYYPWFPQTWHSGDHYHPALGKYSSDNRTVVASQIAQMRYAGLQAAIASWWGQGHQHEDTRFPILFRAAAAQGFRITPYYEPEGLPTDPSLSRVKSDLAYLRRYQTRYPNGFLTVNGKPVIFVYNATNTSCADVRKWSDATNGFSTWYVSLKVFPGFETCGRQPSSWHQYGPASPYSVQAPFYANASPGFWKYGEAQPRLSRDPARFCRDLRKVATSGTRLRLVTSFNEWGEGTAVEPAREWQTGSGMGRYLDLMHRVFVLGKGCG